MLAMHIAPGLRRHFAAEKWKAVPGNIWDNERIAAKALERRDEGFLAFGYDIDPEAVRLTLENAKKAGVAQYISAEVRDIKDFNNDGPFGCVICNPPYGERLLDCLLYTSPASCASSRLQGPYTRRPCRRTSSDLRKGHGTTARNRRLQSLRPAR